MAAYDMDTLKTRVKAEVHFDHFEDNALHYRCVDGYVFAVPIADTANGQGGTATFKATEKGMLFMRWIRKAMELEAEATSYFGCP